MKWIYEEFKKSEGIDISKDNMAVQRIKEAAEKAKIELSSTTSTDVNLPFITADASGPKHLNLTLTLAKFDQLTEGLVERSMEPCRVALEDAGLALSDIDEVVLVGGSTRIPAIQKRVKDFFNKEPNKGVNADEVVAIGAAVQAGVLAGDESVKDVLLLDVTPLSLGIETMGGIMTKLIEKNTTIPTRKSQVFSTAEDNQTAVGIMVLQGEREMARHNRTLGRFELSELPPAPRGVPQIEVTFDIDANGIVNVSAKDKATGKEQKIKIESSSGLSEEEIEKMVKEAEANSDADKLEKEKVETKNQAEQTVYATEKLIKEHGDKVSEEDKKATESALEELKKIKDSENLDEVKEAVKKVEEASHKISEAMYKEAADKAKAEGGANPQEGGVQGNPQQPQDKGAEKDGAVDADYEVVD